MKASTSPARIQAGCILVGDEFRAPDQAVVSALDSGFLLGDGIFESLRSYNGTPFQLKEHVARLLTAAQSTLIDNLPSAEEIERRVVETMRRSELVDAYIRITVTRGVAATSGSGSNRTTPTIVVAVLPLPLKIDDQSGRGIDCLLLHNWIDPQPTQKTTSRQPAVLAQQKVTAAACDEGLYVSPDGFVTEGIGSNVFLVKDKVVVTPPTNCCLAGITRQTVISIVEDEDSLSIAEAPITLEALLACDELLITNSLRGLRAVITVDGKKVGSGARGPTFILLAALYDHAIRPQSGTA